MEDGQEVQRRCTISVWPAEAARRRGVAYSSFREMVVLSWPRERRRVQIERWPRWAARWREVLLRPRGVGSGLWRREGWVLRMRDTRRGLLAWIALRRRREGSILWWLVSMC